MLRAVVGLVVVVLAGCPGDGPDGGDRDAGVDARSDADAPPGGVGLIFELGTAPVVPGSVGNVTVDEVRVSWHDVRAIGDSAPGDPTFRAELSLEWKDGEEPAALAFPEAPPGRYSSLQARMGGEDDDGYRIHGSVVLTGGTEVSFEVRDDAALSVLVPLAGVEVDRAPVVATVTLSLAFLSSVSWDEAPREGDEIRIEPGNPLLPAISAAMATSFSLTGVH